jgi:hypothetical protein
MLLRQVVLATLPHLSLALHQLPVLSACQHSLLSVSRLNLQASTDSSTMLPQHTFLQNQAINRDSDWRTALARLPYVRHVVLRRMGSGLLLHLWPLLQLQHLQEITLQVRRSKDGLLDAVAKQAGHFIQLACAELFADQQALLIHEAAEQQLLAGSDASVADRSPAQHAAADRTAAAAVPHPSAAPADPAAARPGATPRSYKGAVLFGAASHRSSVPDAATTATLCIDAGQGGVEEDYSSRLGSSCSSSSSSSKQTGSQAARMLTPPASLSTIQRLTLQRANLCSLYATQGSSAARSSSSRSSSKLPVACPLSWIARHLTNLRSLALQNVSLERGGLASLTSLETCAEPPWCQPNSQQQLLTPLTSSLQVRMPGHVDIAWR